MNNHIIICKNNYMIIFLIILFIIILIMLNKKVKINIDFSTIGLEYNFCVNINYFLDIITLYKEDFFKYKEKFKKNKNHQTNLKSYKWILKYIDIEKINIETKIGLYDILATSITIAVISTILAIILQKKFMKTVKQFSVKPVYNQYFFSLKGALYISVRMKDIIYIIFKIWKNNKK